MLPNDKYPKGYQFDPDNLEFLKGGMTFAGLISMIDPPRPGVAAAVQTCRSAGIKVVMVTGTYSTFRETEALHEVEHKILHV